MIAIYKITCSKNNKFYIGSAMNTHRRWIKHRSALKKGYHHNKHLQSAWDKYGENCFNFEILEECEEEQLIKREQFWLDKTECYKREVGFNKASVASNNTNSKRYTVIDPDGKEYDVVNLEKFCRKNDLEKTGLHKVANGECNQYKEWVCKHYKDSWDDWEKQKKRSNKSGAGWKGRWKLTRIDNSIIIVDTLNGYCKSNNLSYGSLYAIFTGRIKKSQGFKKVEKCV